MGYSFTDYNLKSKHLIYALQIGNLFDKYYKK
jgi:hypothetical protein